MPEPTFDQGGGLNVRLIVTLIVGVVVLAAAAVGAYAVLGTGGDDGVEEEVVEGPVTVGTPTPTATTALSPAQQVAVLAPQPGQEGSGEAARMAAEDRFVLAVSADLPDPKDDAFYEVYLTQPEPLSQFAAGRLYKVGERWVMTLDQTRDASAYAQVSITLERKDDDKPEEAVLTGSF
ncbi:MAG: anti-sigma factor [bacterium]|nr:anti-sigma factor [bacterium]